MMVIFSALVALALVVSTEGSVGPSSNSTFCSESKECLEYELVCKTEEYEVRHYSPTRWVSTDAEAYFMGVGAAMAFRRLFQYITGANNAGVQMEMTAPVLVKIPEETKLWEPAIYTLSFPLPSAYQDQPPSPTNDKLYFTEMPAMDVYVRSYGGWMLSITSRLHTHLLTKELNRVGASYNHTFHYGVGYDSPLKLVNRHNEVWYVAEGEPCCTDPQEPTPAHTTTPTPTLSDSPTDASPDSPPHTLSDSPLSSVAPSNVSSVAPTNLSSVTPSNVSSTMPSNLSSVTPSNLSSAMPSNLSSVMPSNLSSMTPSNLSSVTPSNLSSATPSNVSSDTPSVSSSSQSPSNAPSSLSPSHAPPSTASHLPAEASFGDSPVFAAQVSGDPTSNYTNDVSASPSLEPQAADVDLWNNTVHSSPETQADSQ